MSTAKTTPTFLVLGATGGIGSALCRKLSADGAELVLSARRRGLLESLAGELGARSIPADATNPEAVVCLFERAQQEFGRIDGVAHCVGSILLKPAHLTDDEEWESVLRLNLSSAFYVTRAAARFMGKNGGSVVLVSSAAARLGLANHEAVAAAKAGVQGLVLSAAATYAKAGLRFNCVAPGLVDTPLAAPLTSNEMMRKASCGMHPLGRIGTPEDVASAIAWLLDPAQSWVTGQIIGIDGGLGSVRAR